jgi:hypothetical protein
MPKSGSDEHLPAGAESQENPTELLRSLLNPSWLGALKVLRATKMPTGISFGVRQDKEPTPPVD